MLHISVVIPIYGREELAKRVILYYETLEVQGVNLTVIPVLDLGSGDGERMGKGRIINDSPVLGKKFNTGISWSKLIADFDGVMIVGSDDLISPYIFNELAKQEPHYMEIGGCHFFESQTGRMRFIHAFNCGAGKYFSKEFLDRCYWQPYDDTANINVDRGPRKFLGSGERLIWQSSKHIPFCIDVKTKSENMWDFGWVEKAEQGVELTAAEIGKCFKDMNNERPEWWRGL